MADQYWVLPVAGITQDETAHGAPVAQLPDTSGMIEIKLDASFTWNCYSNDAGVWCSPAGTVSDRVLFSAGYRPEECIWGASIAAGASGAGTYASVSIAVDISPDVVGFRYDGHSHAIPLTTRLYVAFDAPATASELRTTYSGRMGDGALRLVVDVSNPPSTSIKFRMFMADWTRPEFWTALVNAAEIV